MGYNYTDKGNLNSCLPNQVATKITYDSKGFKSLYTYQIHAYMYTRKLKVADFYQVHYSQSELNVLPV